MSTSEVIGQTLKLKAAERFALIQMLQERGSCTPSNGAELIAG